MTSAHLIFIPAVLAVGFLLGFLFSRQWAQDQIDRALKREKEREEARRRRAERRKKKGASAKKKAASDDAGEAEAEEAAEAS